MLLYFHGIPTAPLERVDTPTLTTLLLHFSGQSAQNLSSCQLREQSIFSAIDLTYRKFSAWKGQTLYFITNAGVFCLVGFFWGGGGGGRGGGGGGGGSFENACMQISRSDTPIDWKLLPSLESQGPHATDRVEEEEEQD